MIFKNDVDLLEGSFGVGNLAPNSGEISILLRRRIEILSSDAAMASVSIIYSLPPADSSRIQYYCSTCYVSTLINIVIVDMCFLNFNFQSRLFLVLSSGYHCYTYTR